MTREFDEYKNALIREGDSTYVKSSVFYDNACRTNNKNSLEMELLKDIRNFVCSLADDVIMEQISDGSLLRIKRRYFKDLDEMLEVMVCDKDTIKNYTFALKVDEGVITEMVDDCNRTPMDYQTFIWLMETIQKIPDFGFTSLSLAKCIELKRFSENGIIDDDVSNLNIKDEFIYKGNPRITDEKKRFGTIGIIDDGISRELVEMVGRGSVLDNIDYKLK